MTAVAASPVPQNNTAAAPVRLEQFLERVRTANPFTDNRVNGPSPRDVDVAGIHQTAFAQLTTLAREACSARRGIGAVLWGEAGIGKSHVLSRLSRWAEENNQARLIYLHNLQARPENLPRSILRAVLGHLVLRREYGWKHTPLFQLVLGFVSESLDHDHGAPHPWPKVERAYTALVQQYGADDPSRTVLADRTVYQVLLRFFHAVCHEHVRVIEVAVRWLMGDYLDAEEARLLGLPPVVGAEGVAALEDNQQIKHVLVALTRLARSRERPFLLCFDQVDNLDAEQVASLTRFLEAVIDSVSNLLVVLAGVKASLLDFRASKVIQDSAWDRVAQIEIDLHRISIPQAREIVAARLEQFVQPYRDLDRLDRLSRDQSLFPLGERWFREFLQGKIDIRPRDAINWAREGWRREQHTLHERGGAIWLEQWDGELPRADSSGTSPALVADQIQEAIDRKVGQKLREHYEERRRRPDALPPDADNLCGLVLTLLRQCQQVQPGCPITDLQRPPTGIPNRTHPYHVLLQTRRNPGERTMRTGLLVLSTASARSTTATLRWLVQDARTLQRVVMVTEERRPLAFGQKVDAQGRALYQQLRQRSAERFIHVELPFEQYAYLDALQAVVGMARSGELEAELPPGHARPITEPEVLASHQRQGRYAKSVLLREFVQTDASGSRERR